MLIDGVPCCHPNASLFNFKAQSLMGSPMTYSIFEYAKEQAIGLLELETVEAVSELALVSLDVKTMCCLSIS